MLSPCHGGLHGSPSQYASAAVVPLFRRGANRWRPTSKRLRKHQPTVVPPLSFASPHTRGSAYSLATKDQSDVGPLSCRVTFKPVSAPLQDDLRLLRHPIPTRSPAYPCGPLSTFPVGTVGLTTFRTRTIPEGLRPRLSVGSATSTWEDVLTSQPDCIPFGSCLSASLAWLRSRRLNSGSLTLVISFNPSSQLPRG